MVFEFSRRAFHAFLFGAGFSVTVLMFSVTEASAKPSAALVQVCLGSQNPSQGTCADCNLSYQSGIVNGNNCTPCRYGFSWTIDCGSFESGGNQSDQLACGAMLGPINIPCPGGSGTAFSFNYACSQCQ